MGTRNILMLPPAMNFSRNYVGIDDFQRRYLHEAIGDMASQQLEFVADAPFEQRRVVVTGVDWYLPRLLGGCMMRAVLADTTPASFTDYVKRAVLSAGRLTMTAEMRAALSDRIVTTASLRWQQTLHAWSGPEFSGSESADWARQQLARQAQQPADQPPTACEDLALDLLRYVDLVMQWPIFCTAVRRTDFTGHAWLYRRCDDPL